MQSNSPKLIRWKLVDQIVDELLDSPPSHRKDILANRCGGDVNLLLEVEKLLAATEKAADFMEVSALATESETLDDEIGEALIGGRVGRYRLLRLIGRGGMGDVFLAVRDDDEFRKTVAVKLVNPFWSDDQMVQRFRRERQILAKLEHPNIARLFDGGTTKDKVSFLVMEYVAGMPITEYCRDRCKTTKDRLKIFLKVCEAVKFAHQNLIIHRDLKPHNILVTADGTVKLLDFGVAKLLQPELLDVSQNLTVSNILTPNYASPEQLKGETITTASDVYSLGVLLYELLTGNRPYDLKDKSLPEMLRIINEQMPPRPSETEVRMREQMPNPSLSASGLHSRAGARRSLRGDLDNICLKALAKNRAERYQTVGELIADINRHFASLPIHARQPSIWYRINKYFNRHRFGTAAATVILILVFGWLASALWQRNIARRQAEENLQLAYAADMILGMLAYERANLIQLNDILARYQNTAFTTNWEYRFLQNLARPKAQLLVIPHPSDVWDVTFSPDGRLFATACADGFARIYSVPEGNLLATTATKELNIWRLKFSPDSTSLVIASGDANSTAVKVWNAKTGNEVLSLVGHTARVRGVDLSPDGNLIATGSRDGTVRLWSATDGRELRRFTIERNNAPTEIEDLDFTPDGSKLIVASNSMMTLVEVSPARILFQADVVTGLTASAVSPDGKQFVLGGLDGKIQIYQLDPVRKVRETAGHETRINNLAFSANGTVLASASSDRTIRFFDPQTADELQVLKTHSSEAWSMAFSPTGRFIATCGTDFNVFLFDQTELLKASSFAVSTIGRSWSAISPDRTKAALPFVNPGPRKNQTLWDVTAKRQISEFASSTVLAGAFSPDSSVLATVDNAGITSFWNSATGLELRRFHTHIPIADGVVFTPDGKQIVTAGVDKTVKIWDVDRGTLNREFCRVNDHITALAFSTDGRSLFVAGLDTTATLFDFATGKIVAEIGKQRKPITAVEFSPDGQTFATGGSAGDIQIRRVSDAQAIAILTGSAGRVTALTYSPDSSRLISASGDGVTRFWDLKTFAQVLAIHTGGPHMSFLAFTPDGNTLISHGSAGKVRTWEAAPR